MRLRRSRLLAFAVVVALAACGGPPLPPSVVDLVRREADAAAAFSESRWDDASARFEELAKWIELSGDPRRAGRGDAAWYNAACAHARAGRPDDAVRCLAASLRNGLRPIDTLAADGTWIAGKPLRIEHIVADPDLDAIRAHPGYAAALAPFTAAGAVTVESLGPAGGTSVVHLLGPVVDVEFDSGETTVFAEPPIEDGSQNDWTLSDGNVQFGAARVRAAVSAAVAAGADPARVRIVAWTDGASRAAWRAVLDDPSRVGEMNLGALPWDEVDDADRLAAFAQSRRAAGLPPLAVRCTSAPPGADALAASMIVVRVAR